MSNRYQEFRLELIEDHTTLAEAERLKRHLLAEIEGIKAWRAGTPDMPVSLRMAYAETELRATTDHIAEILRQMALEEAEAQ